MDERLGLASSSAGLPSLPAASNALLIGPYASRNAATKSAGEWAERNVDVLR